MTGVTNSEIESTLSMESAGLLISLSSLSDSQLDRLDFGVIAFGQDCLVKRYNHFETESTGLARDYVITKHVFTNIAQCMNNYMVAQRFENAWISGHDLDESLNYVLTWRMKPTRVRLRLLWSQSSELAYIVLSPRTALDTQSAL